MAKAAVTDMAGEPICMHTALTHDEREDIREAAEALLVDGAAIRSTDEWVEAILEEAEARSRRREIALVKTCPHCGEVLDG